MTVKEYLMQPLKMKKDINRAREALENLRDEAEDFLGICLEAGSKSEPLFDSEYRFSKIVKRIELLENELEELFLKRIDTYKEISDFIDCAIDTEMEREVLRRRYLMGESREEVAYKIDKGIRTVRRYEETALEKAEAYRKL